jgi:hypothetical protein
VLACRDEGERCGSVGTARCDCERRLHLAFAAPRRFLLVCHTPHPPRSMDAAAALASLTGLGEHCGRPSLSRSR